MVCQMFFKCYYISEIQKLYIVPIFLQFPNFYLTIGQSFLDHINNIQLELLVHSYLHGSDFVAEELRKEYVDLNEVASDNNDDKNDDDNGNSKDVEVVEISRNEVKVMFDC